MADVKVTKMVIELDHHCSKCDRIIKKALCCCPEILDQVYNLKENTVTFTVVGDSPERIRQRIRQKIATKTGLKSIKIVPDTPIEPPRNVDPDRIVTFDLPPNVAEPPKAPAPAPAPKAPAPAPTVPFAPRPKPKAPVRAPIQPPALPGPVVIGIPWQPPPHPVPMYPVGVCCCCHAGGPCYHGRGPMCYDGCGRPSCQCSGGNRGYYVSHCNEYFREENPSGCGVM